jgi:cytochrome c oxidase subunit 3
MSPAIGPDAGGAARHTGAGGKAGGDIRAGVAGQFVDRMRERQASLLGMWAFLATEVLFFGGMFTAYSVYRIFYGHAFQEASRHLSAFWGGLNTALLLVSSGAIAMAVRGVEADRRKAAAGWFLSAGVLGLGFIAIKAHEYATDYREHTMPLRGLPFEFPGADADQARLFYNLYFVMTGIHAIHLFIGIVLVGVMAFLCWRGRFSLGRHAPAEAAGLYWHFVDAVWVFLYPLFYLIGR